MCTRPDSSMPRRAFVRRLPLISAGVALTPAAFVSACAGVRYVTPVAGSDRLEILSSALAPGDGVMVQNEDMERPIHLRRLPSGALLAVLASCTHNGCQPAPVADRLICPCHGSEFTWAGAVLNGPAERPLTRYPVTEEGGGIIISIPTEGTAS